MASRRGLVLALRALEGYNGHAARQAHPKSAQNLGLWSCGLGLAGVSVAASSAAAVFVASGGWEPSGGRGDLRCFASAMADAAFHHGVPPGLFPPITLYQYETCPFCNKVKAFLDYHKIPYEVVEVNPLTKQELKWSSFKKVPVVKLGEEKMNESNSIIDAMAEKVEEWKRENQKKSSWFGGAKVSPASTEEEAKWRKWVDDRLMKIITANIYRSWGESWKTFDYITDHGNFNPATRQAARLFGTTLMWRVGKGMPKKYNIQGDLREALYEALDEWADAVGDRDFMGGREANLADLAVFGVMRSIVGTPTFHDMLANSKVLPWYQRMMELVGESSRTNPVVK